MEKSIQKISKIEARELVANSQLLNSSIKCAKGKKGAAEIIDKLGYLQIDTISVINRAHHHVLWTRRHDYTEKHLHDLQAKDKLIFEYWTHAMSFIPMKDYRFALHRMKNFEKPQGKWMKYRYEQSKKYFKPVLERIANEGILSSSDFENDTGKKGGTWWDWKPAKTALEYLFWKGDLMIAERKGFQKFCNLTERVLPSDVDTTLPTANELNRFFIQRALSSLGIASKREIEKFMQPGRAGISDLQVTERKTMYKVIDDMCEGKEIIPLEIEGDHKIVNYALPETLRNNSKKKNSTKKVHILSPFDNLIIQRNRTKRLFDFDYAIECYLPEHKRKYGYFVLPIIWGNEFVGRMDSKADRQVKKLVINNIVFEENFDEYDEFLPYFAKRLKLFAEFNGCNSTIIKKCKPMKIKKAINQSINQSIITFELSKHEAEIFQNTKRF
ncbi:MAG: winged helix DNA-binding domain-containing protein [Melioribacteraceae bacterium]|nr:winged helix DNA-binding domain-containing protein [Melioribacteraceae bacterium]MCF8353678.1 winged helix DNA-binding domain-containing protein [Melioribacteraceae bacterium]MCF8394460.1 winged helix DNA-binding domain-containing protein [Melioribacteraceae bacterium]MCF8418594.1 winged helix DNA-binding domain-containing protein [Melioribacteraceae bacterium]